MNDWIAKTHDLSKKVKKKNQNKTTMLDSSDEESGGFKINEAYASKYNEWRRREELQKRKLA